MMEKIYKNLDVIIEKIKDDYDYCIAITGRKRRGKSTFGYWISEYISKKLKSRVWLTYNYPELREAMFNSKQYDVIFADETIGFLNAANWYAPEAKEFVELFDRMGYKNLTIILIMPEFKNFIKGFRESRLDAHIWIKKRGVAHVFSVKESKLGSYFPDKPQLIENFDQLPEEKEREYRRIKEESMEKRIKVMKEYGFDPKIKLRRANYKLKTEYMMTQKERARIFEVGERTVRRWDKQDKEEQLRVSVMSAIKPNILSN